jgi:CheY-like chemotaxis protein
LAPSRPFGIAKAPEPLSHAPAAIYVITHGQIVRSGAKNLAEALRLAPNLQVIRLSSSDYMVSARGFGGAPQAQNFSNKMLILIDGRSVYSPLFSGVYLSGYRIAVCHSGREALEVALREQPDALVLDIGMPGMSGYEMAQRVRRESWGRDALLIAVTGWGQQEDRERSRAAGFDHHLTKPVDTEALQRLLSELARRLHRAADRRG